MDEVNDFESTPQVACSLSPIETAILIFIVAYIIIKGVKKFITHRFSSSQQTESVREDTSEDKTVAEPEPIKVRDVVEMNGSSSKDQYYVVLSRNHNGDVAITNSTFKVKFNCKPGQLKRVEHAQNKQVTIEEYSVFQCTRNMSVASVQNPRELKIFMENEFIVVTQDLENGMVEGHKFGEEDSYYFPALLLKE